MKRLAVAALLLAACAGGGDPHYPLAGRTYLSAGPGHGVQIEYLTHDKAWLWYPGNSRAVEGRWRIAPGRHPLICFTYEARSYNPVTRRPGGTEGCEPLADVAARIRESVPGDVFNLASGQVPKRRARCEVPAPFKPAPSTAC